MSVEAIGQGKFVETSPVYDEPECVRLEPDPGPAFRDFMLPRLESARDEASAEVLAALRAGQYLGDAVASAIESLPARKTQRLRAWVEEARSTRVYAYVWFHGLARLSYGLWMTTGGPRDEIIAHEEVGQYELADFAPYWEFDDALREIKRKPSLRYALREDPMVKINDEDEYNEALAVMDLPPEGGVWVKPGLYDFRDRPPTYSGTLDDYRRDSMRQEAEKMLGYLFESDEIKSACKTLLEKS